MDAQDSRFPCIFFDPMTHFVRTSLARATKIKIEKVEAGITWQNLASRLCKMLVSIVRYRHHNRRCLYILHSCRRMESTLMVRPIKGTDGRLTEYRVIHYINYAVRDFAYKSGTNLCSARHQTRVYTCRSSSTSVL